MIHNVMHIIGIEILQNRNHNRSVSDGCHVGNAPARIILSYDSDLLAAPDAAIFEQQMQLGYFTGYFTIRIIYIFAVVSVTRKVSILTKTILVEFDKILFNHCTNFGILCKNSNKVPHLVALSG